MPTRIQGVIATTHLDLQGERLTKSALESMVAQINAKECLGVVVEHDPLVPPLGKVVSAVLRQRPDGEYEVYAVSELFDDAEEVTLSDGSIGLMMHLPSDTRPFARR